MDIEENRKQNDSSSDKDEYLGLDGCRWGTIFMLLVWVICVVISYSSLGWTGINCQENFDDDFLERRCVHNSAVYRICAAAIIVLFVQCLLGLFTIRTYDGYWFLKLPFFVGLSLALLYSGGAIFEDSAYEWVGRIGGVIFLVFMQTLVLDFAYTWKQSWIDKSTRSGRIQQAALEGSDFLDAMQNFWLCALLVVSVFYIVIFVIVMSLLYRYFGTGENCEASQSIITVSLVLMVGALVIQLLFVKNGSIMGSGILAVYVAYLTYLAVSLNPDAECNPTLRTKTYYGIGPQIIGLVFSFLSIVWTAAVVSRRMGNLMSSGSYTESGVLNVVTGSQSKAKSNGLKSELKEKLRVTVVNLNVVFILICFYVSMTLTNWGTLATAQDESNSPTTGRVSMWMQGAGAWISIVLYIIGLIVPTFKILPTSIWDLQPRF